MARKPRIDVPSSVYHVVPRGYNGRKLFPENPDSAGFSRLPGEGEEPYGHRIYVAYLMPINLHPVIQAGSTTLSTAVYSFKFSYSRRQNLKQGKRYPLFETGANLANLF